MIYRDERSAVSEDALDENGMSELVLLEELHLASVALQTADPDTVPGAAYLLWRKGQGA